MLLNCLRLFTSFISLSAILSFQANGQGAVESWQPSASQANVYRLYMNSVGKAAHIYTGSAYTARYLNAKGSPFFSSSNFEQVDLSLSGVIYHQIPVKYDMVTQEVIVSGPGGETISLPGQKIDSFYLNGHVFERLHADSTDSGELPEAFYDRLYAGRRAKLYVQRSRVIHQSLRAEDPSVFDVYDTYVIQKEDRYFSINSQRSLQRILGLRSQELKFDTSHNRLNWKKDPEKVLRAAIEIYDMSMK